MEQITLSSPCYNQQQIFDFIASVIGQKNIIPIPTEFIRFTGEYHTAALLTQIIYWRDKTKDPDKWFYKSYAEWEEELALSKYQVNRAAGILKSMGIIETKVKMIFNGDKVLHYRLDIGIFISKFGEFLNRKLQNTTSKETSLLEVKKLDSLKSGNFTPTPLYTETTSLKTTTTKQEQKIEQKDVDVVVVSPIEFDQQQAAILLELVPENHRKISMIEKFISKSLKKHTPDEIKAAILYSNSHSTGDTEKYRSYLGLSLKNGWSDGVLESFEETNRLMAETEKAKEEAAKLKKEAHFNKIKKEKEEKEKRKFQNEYLDNLKTNDINKFIEIQNLALKQLKEERPTYKLSKDGLSVFLKMCKILGI